MASSLERLLAALEEARHRFGPGEAARTERLLVALARLRFPDAASLIRFHEALLFLRAYPAGEGVRRRADELLFSFAARVAALREPAGPLEEPEVSGIAGTAFSAVFSYAIARALARLEPGRVEVDWDGYETGRLARCWRHALPLLDEDALVEANVPYLQWLHSAKRGGSDLAWILRRLDPDAYDSLELPLRWNLGEGRATRSRTRLPVSNFYYHQGPLLRRHDVQLAQELAAPPLPLQPLSRAEGEAMLDLARESSAARYRELYGFTYGDPARVRKAGLGRGTEVYVFGVPPARRLPLRAYHAGLIFKNGVPLGYIETLSLFERMEIGFNVYYTFREGESGWLYARLLRLFRQLTGAAVFSVDPYQVGHENEEGIASGAFWFYRKLGFRPTGEEPARLLEREERRLAADPAYRTPAATLRRLAASHMLYEVADSGGAWDRFTVRNLGLAVQRHMARHFGGDAGRMRRACSARIARLLASGLPSRAEDLALVLALIPNLERWPASDRALLARIVRAKAGPDETRYLRLMQAHTRLRAAILKLGSAMPH